MSLIELARQYGRNLAQIGLPKQTAWAISSGVLRAGPRSISRIAAELAVPTTVVAAACDAAWQAKQRPTAPDASAIDPSANGAQVVHAANSTDGVAP